MAYIARSIPRSTADSLPASSCPESFALARSHWPASGNLREEPSAGKPLARICGGENRMVELPDHHRLQRRFIEPITRRLAHHTIMVFDVKGRIELPLVGKGCQPLRPGISIMLEKDDG